MYDCLSKIYLVIGKLYFPSLFLAMFFYPKQFGEFFFVDHREWVWLILVLFILSGLPTKCPGCKRSTTKRASGIYAPTGYSCSYCGKNYFIKALDKLYSVEEQGIILKQKKISPQRMMLSIIPNIPLGLIMLFMILLMKISLEEDGGSTGIYILNTIYAIPIIGSYMLMHWDGSNKYLIDKIIISTTKFTIGLCLLIASLLLIDGEVFYSTLIPAGLLYLSYMLKKKEF